MRDGSTVSSFTNCWSNCKEYTRNKLNKKKNSCQWIKNELKLNINSSSGYDSISSYWHQKWFDLLFLA
jgi:hypothetical protein